MKGKRKPKPAPKGNQGPAFLVLTLGAGVVLLALPNWVGGFIVVVMYVALIAHYQGAKKKETARPKGKAASSNGDKNMKASFRASKSARGSVRHDDEPFELFDESNVPTPGFAVPRPPQGMQVSAPGEKLRIPNRPTAADCWVPRDIAFTVHQYRIHVGLVYCGTGLESVASRGEPDPSLVNEKLRVGEDDEYRTRKLEYYPSYATATPDARAGYLNWLANGRRDKKANIGYVYLYFYGLERRAFIDAHSDPVARAEIPTIIEEVEALLSVYTKSKTFVERAKIFTNTLRAVATGSRKYLDQPPALAVDEGRSYLHSVALAQAYRDDFAYPVEWLLSWYLASKEFERPRAVIRCLKQFENLFRLELPKRFPDNPGAWVDSMKARRLTLTYDALYPKLGRVNVAMAEADQLVDVTEPSLNLHRLLDTVAKDVAAQLEMYSRYIGNSVEKAASDEAQLLLPRPLWSAEPRMRLENISASLSEVRIVSEPVKFATLLSPLNPRFVAGFFRNVVSHVETAFGLCMEPDPRFGTALPSLESSVVFFRAPETPQIPDGETLPPDVLAAWLKKTSAVWFYAAIVRADPSNQEAKRAAAASVIAQMPLMSAEKARLRALFEVLVTDMPAAGLKKRGQDLTPVEATKVAGELVQICQAGGGLTNVVNIRTLEKLFEVLGQDANQLYSMAHAGAAVATDAAGLSSRSGANNVEAAAHDTGNRDNVQNTVFGLDRERMARLREETAQASAMLGAIFQQDEAPQLADNQPEGASSTKRGDEATVHAAQDGRSSGLATAQAQSTTLAPDAPPEVLLPGLNDTHNSLLVRLLEKDAWERSEIAALCTSFGLMVDAAIERINDAAFNKFDDSLLEGDESFEINMDIAGELRA